MGGAWVGLLPGDGGVWECRGTEVPWLGLDEVMTVS